MVNVPLTSPNANSAVVVPAAPSTAALVWVAIASPDAAPFASVERVATASHSACVFAPMTCASMVVMVAMIVSSVQSRLDGLFRRVFGLGVLLVFGSRLGLAWCRR